MSRSLRTTLALLLALAGVGCTSGGDVVAWDGELTQGSVGVLHVDRLVQDGELSDPTIPDPTVLSAAFARYRGLDSGAVLGLLGSRSAAELESCAFVGEDESIAETGEVELLDVGTIRVRVAGTEASLAPRAFPDLASVLAGVFYTGDASLAVPRGDVDEYAFQAAGSEEVPAFDAVVPAPAEPTELRIDGARIDGIDGLEVESVTLVRDVGVDVVWASGDPRDVVEIEVHAHGDVLACAARDDGAFHVESDALATLAPDAAATLVVRRVRVTSVDVPGLEDAFARVAVTRELPADLR